MKLNSKKCFYHQFATLEPFVGRGPNDAAYSNELYKTVKEGLLVNPYILNVSAEIGRAHV